MCCNYQSISQLFVQEVSIPPEGLFGECRSRCLWREKGKAMVFSVVPLYHLGSRCGVWCVCGTGNGTRCQRQLLGGSIWQHFPSIDLQDLILYNTNRRGQTHDVYTFISFPLFLVYFLALWGMLPFVSFFYISEFLSIF